MADREKVGVVGAGAWGTALALTACRAGHAVTLWAREADVVEAINQSHENPRFLPGVALDPALHATGDVAAAAAADIVLFAVPAQYLRAVAQVLTASATSATAAATPIVICAKGLERDSGALMSEVLAEAIGAAPVAVLSGPTFAAEVARGLPTAVTLAATDAALGERLARALGGAAFRPYLSDDLIGAQMGGAVKNVLAIAAGIAIGRRLGENARAAIMTRGYAEMARLALAKGARFETLAGLSGLGDLVLTCTSRQSRNFSLGCAIGEGESLAEILGRRDSVAEGVASAPAVVALAERLGVDMPIARAVHAVLHEGAGIDETIGDLLARPFAHEL